MNNKLVTWQQFVVDSQYHGYRLDKLMKKLQPHWSKVFVYKLIAKKAIRVNHQRTTSNYHLQKNDLITYYGLTKVTTEPVNQFTLQQIKKLPPLVVIYEDDQVIIVHKPPKVSVQANYHHHYDTMNNRLINHLQWTNHHQFQPVFVHRLDMNTSGLLVGAKTYHAYQALFLAFKNQQVVKIYDLLVWGKVVAEKIELKNYLLKQTTNQVKVVNQPLKGAKWAHSTVIKVHNYDHTTHLQVQLHTGRTHQIRAQLSHLGHGICGDRKYTVNLKNKKFPYQALVASGLKFHDQVCQGVLAGLLNQTWMTKQLWFLKEKYTSAN